MSSMKDPNTMSDSDIESFFARQGAWQADDRHEIIEVDPQAHTLSTTFGGQDPRWYDQCLRLALQSSCCLCGKHLSGDAITKVLVTFKPSQNLVGVWAVCDECTVSTSGRSPMQLYYRAWFAQIEKKIRPKWIGVMGSQILTFEEGLP
jgi:hypothetical protein